MKKILLSISMVAIASITFAQTLSVTMSNISKFAKNSESVVVEWDKITKKIHEATASNIVVLNEDGQQVASQPLYNGGTDVKGLLFQADIDAKKHITYTIKSGKRNSYQSKVFGRLVPERKDDFAWENNKIGYRMYGPALQATGEISSGIDVWIKSTDKLIINKWYKLNKYHVDHGEGLDAYKVGPTLGCGATAPIVNNNLVMSKNFTKATILENGPIRISFKLDYAPFKVGDKMVKQTRIITLDANKNLNKVETTFEGDFKDLEVATGIVLRGAAGTKSHGDNYIAYAEPMTKKNGKTYCLSIVESKGEYRDIKNHMAIVTKIKEGETFTYLTGSYWSKGGMKDSKQWSDTYIKESTNFITPLKVKIK